MQSARWWVAVLCLVSLLGTLGVAVHPLSARDYEGVHVIVPAANVRAGPGVSHDVRFVASWGELLLVVDRDDLPWICVNSPGRSAGGWIHKRLVSDIRPQWKGRGVSATSEFDYTREGDSCSVHLTPPMSSEDQIVGPFLLEFIARAYGQLLRPDLSEAAIGDSAGLTYVDGGGYRYLLQPVLVDSEGIESLRVWRETR